MCGNEHCGKLGIILVDSDVLKYAQIGLKTDPYYVQRPVGFYLWLVPDILSCLRLLRFLKDSKTS